MIMQSVASFTAVAECPSCGDIGVHWLDEPRLATPEEWDEYERRVIDYEYEPHDTEKVVTWGGRTVREIPVQRAPKPPLHEHFTVARICRSCAHRWGND